MAIAYQSKASSTNGLSATPTNLTLPTGSASGELLLIHETGTGSVNAQDVFAVSGGTQLSAGQNFKNGDGYHSSSLWYKFLNGTDISNGYITVNGSDSFGKTSRIILYRISGISTAAQIVDGDDISTSDTTPSYNHGVTPFSVNNLVFIFASGYANGTTSGYAIATSNPSWTEVTDETVNLSGGDTLVIAGAYGLRPEATALGNASLTFSSADTSKGIVISLSEDLNASVSPSVIDVTATIQEPAVSAGATVTASVIDVTASVIAPTVSFPTETWTNQSKNSSTWTNQSKS